jgi:hypothetical protein
MYVLGRIKEERTRTALDPQCGSWRRTCKTLANEWGLCGRICTVAGSQKNTYWQMCTATGKAMFDYSRNSTALGRQCPECKAYIYGNRPEWVKFHLLMLLIINFKSIKYICFIKKVLLNRTLFLFPIIIRLIVQISNGWVVQNSTTCS